MPHDEVLYEVTIIERRTASVVLRARTPAEARRKAKKLYDRGEVILETADTTVDYIDSWNVYARKENET